MWLAEAIYVVERNRICHPKICLWYIDSFELKLVMKQPMQEGHADPPLSF